MRVTHPLVRHPFPQRKSLRLVRSALHTHNVTLANYVAEGTAETHEQKSTSGKFVCTCCPEPKAFTDRSNLLRHTKGKKGISHVKCPGCCKLFTRPDNARTHYWKKHKDLLNFPEEIFSEPDGRLSSRRFYLCPFPRCGRSFARIDDLNQHIALQH